MAHNLMQASRVTMGMVMDVIRSTRETPLSEREIAIVLGAPRARVARAIQALERRGEVVGATPSDLAQNTDLETRYSPAW